jgi:hypothetical protein
MPWLYLSQTSATSRDIFGLRLCSLFFSGTRQVVLDSSTQLHVYPRSDHHCYFAGSGRAACPIKLLDTERRKETVDIRITMSSQSRTTAKRKSTMSSPVSQAARSVPSGLSSVPDTRRPLARSTSWQHPLPLLTSTCYPANCMARHLHRLAPRAAQPRADRNGMRIHL